MNTPFQLKNKHILVTGASSSSDIGLGVCKLLASLGATLTLVGRHQETLIETKEKIAHSDKHHIAPFDLENVDDIPAWMKNCAKATSPFDGMVHLASFQGYSPLKTINSKQFNQYFNLNVAASLMLAKGFAKKGVHNAPSSIVFMGSVAGLIGQKGRSLYAASKASLVSITQSLALELVSKQIRVNCVAPAVVLGKKAEEQFKMLPPEQKAELDAAHPMGYGTPEDVANATVYFLSETTKWVTGTTLPLEGGFLLQ